VAKAALGKNEMSFLPEDLKSAESKMYDWTQVYHFYTEEPQKLKQTYNPVV
jgi:hypothetical protein